MVRYAGCLLSAYGYQCLGHNGLEVNEIALVLFVKYHNAFGEAASTLMDREEDLQVVFQAGSVAEGRERMAEGETVQVGVGGENPEPLGAGGEWTTRTFTAESHS